MNIKDFTKMMLVIIFVEVVVLFVSSVIYNPDYENQPLPTQTPYVIKETVEVEVTSIVIITVTVIAYPTATVTPTPSATLWPTSTSLPSPTPTITPTSMVTPTGIISEHLTVNTANCSVNIRGEPNTNAVIVGAVRLGDVAQVLEIVEGKELEGNNIWYKIKGGHFFNSSYSKEYYIWSGAKNLVPFVFDNGDE